MIILEESFKWHLEAFASELFIYSQVTFIYIEFIYFFINIYCHLKFLNLFLDVSELHE